MTTISKETVAQFLIDNGYYLTALEFNQELCELEGKFPPLSRFFDSDPPDIPENELPNFFSLSEDGRKSLERGHASIDLKRRNGVDSADQVQLKKEAVPLFDPEAADREKLLKEEIEILRYEAKLSNETIASLRSELTSLVHKEMNSDIHSSSTSLESDGHPHSLVNAEGLKSYEKKTLNWIVNQYLLSQAYDLTSLTFCDEEIDQDLRSWDSIGLNTVPPPPLLLFLRYFYKAGPNQHLAEVEKSLAKTKKELEKLKGRTQQMHWDHQQFTDAEKTISDLQLQVEKLRRENEALAIKCETGKQAPSDQENSAVTLSNHRDDISEKEKSQVELPSPPNKNQSEKRKRRMAEHTSFPHLREQLKLLRDHHFSLPMTSTSSSSSSSSTFTSSIASGNPSLSTADGKMLQTLRVYSLIKKISECDPASGKVSPVTISGDVLPHLVEGVLLKKREELLPLMITTICHHPDPKTRNDLTRLMFNLIKKPDADYRSIIMAACSSLARLIGPMRVDCELLQICWEQIDHQLEERRVLVAESCGSLARFATASMRRSLLLSILVDQLVDRDAMVRCAVAKNLALLIPWLPPDAADKWIQLEEMFLRLFFDLSEDVREIVRVWVVPTFVRWSRSVGRLRSHFVPLLLGEIRKLLKTIDPSKIRQQEVNRVQKLTDTLVSCLPYLWDDIIINSPFDEGPPSTSASPSVSQSSSSSQKNLSEDEIEEDEELWQLYDDPETVIDSTQKLNLQNQVNSFVTLMNLHEAQSLNSIPSVWPELEWVIKELIEVILQMISTMEAFSSARVSQTFSLLFRALGQTAGPSFSKNVIHSLFVRRLEKDSLLSVPKEVQLHRSRLIPIFLVGVLPVTDVDFRQYLRDLISNIALEECGWTVHQLPMLKDCVKLLCTQKTSPNDSIAESIINRMKTTTIDLLTVEMSRHPSTSVRSIVLHLYNVMVDLLPLSDLEKKLLPAVKQLGNDSDLTVKISSLRPLATLCTMIKSDAILETISIQFDTILQKNMHSLNLEVCRVFTDILPNVKPTFRDGCLLPKLSLLAEENSRNPNDSQRGELAKSLFTAFKAFNSGAAISLDTISMYVTPSLRQIALAGQHLDEQTKQVFASAIQEYETITDSGDADQKKAK